LLHDIVELPTTLRTTLRRKCDMTEVAKQTLLLSSTFSTTT
jgi:hypothetical protein